MTRKEQIEFMKQQIRFLNSQEMEMAQRRHKIELALEKLEDEEALEKAKKGLGGM